MEIRYEEIFPPSREQIERTYAARVRQDILERIAKMPITLHLFAPRQNLVDREDVLAIVAEVLGGNDAV